MSATRHPIRNPPTDTVTAGKEVYIQLLFLIHKFQYSHLRLFYFSANDRSNQISSQAETMSSPRNSVLIDEGETLFMFRWSFYI